MNKITQFLIVFLLSVIAACSKVEAPNRDLAQLTTQLQQLNLPLLVVDDKQPALSTVLPFTKEYLDSRNELLSALSSVDNLTEYQMRELALLTIEQRYTERYFPWPPVTNVIANFNLEEGSEFNQLVSWLGFVESTMKQGAASKIKLNQFEHILLTKQVSQLIEFLAPKQQAESLIGSLTQLETYLTTYQVRNIPGLVGLPNGREWYQARLNYFNPQVSKPIDAYSQVLALQDTQQNCSQEAFLKNYIGEANKQSDVTGFDWRTGYSNRLVQFESIPVCKLQLVVAEVDLGIHSQNWRLEHATNVLANKLALSKEQQFQVLAQILFEPGLALVNINL